MSGPHEGHTNEVKAVAFSADGDYIASGSADQTICIWDAKTLQIVSRSLKGNTHFVKSIYLLT